MDKPNTEEKRHLVCVDNSKWSRTLSSFPCVTSLLCYSRTFRFEFFWQTLSAHSSPACIFIPCAKPLDSTLYKILKKQDVCFLLHWIEPCLWHTPKGIASHTAVQHLNIMIQGQSNRDFACLIHFIIWQHYVDICITWTEMIEKEMLGHIKMVRKKNRLNWVY